MCNRVAKDEDNVLLTVEAEDLPGALETLKTKTVHPLMGVIADCRPEDSPARHLSAVLITLVPTLVSAGQMVAADEFVADVCLAAYAMYGRSVLGSQTHGVAVLAQQLLSYGTMRVADVLQEEATTGFVTDKRTQAISCVNTVLQAVGGLVRLVGLRSEDVQGYIAIEGCITDLRQKAAKWVPVMGSVAGDCAWMFHASVKFALKPFVARRLCQGKAVMEQLVSNREGKGDKEKSRPFVYPRRVVSEWCNSRAIFYAPLLTPVDVPTPIPVQPQPQPHL
jgi:hypothetical protein